MAKIYPQRSKLDRLSFHELFDQSSHYDTCPLVLKSRAKKIFFNHVYEFFAFKKIVGWEEMDSGEYVIWFYGIVKSDIAYKKSNDKKLRHYTYKFGASVVQNLADFNGKRTNHFIIEDNHLVDRIYCREHIIDLLNGPKVICINWNKPKNKMIFKLSLQTSKWNHSH